MYARKRERFGRRRRKNEIERKRKRRDSAIIVGLYTWTHLEVRDEFIAIGVRMNMCRNP